MNIIIRKYNRRDIAPMTAIWNEVVEEGIAFPQEKLLTEETGREFFDSQSHCGVAEDTDTGKVLGLISSIPTTWGAAAISAMQAMRWLPMRGDRVSARSW